MKKVIRGSSNIQIDTHAIKSIYPYHYFRLQVQFRYSEMLKVAFNPHDGRW